MEITTTYCFHLAQQDDFETSVIDLSALTASVKKQICVTIGVSQTIRLFVTPIQCAKLAEVFAKAAQDALKGDDDPFATLTNAEAMTIARRIEAEPDEPTIKCHVCGGTGGDGHEGDNCEYCGGTGNLLIEVDDVLLVTDDADKSKSYFVTVNSVHAGGTEGPAKGWLTVATYKGEKHDVSVDLVQRKGDLNEFYDRIGRRSARDGKRAEAESDLERARR